MMLHSRCIWLPSYPSYVSTVLQPPEPTIQSCHLSTKFIRATTVVDFIGKGVPALRTKTDGYFVSASSGILPSEENATTACCYESGWGLFSQVSFQNLQWFLTCSSNDSTTYATKVFQNLLSISMTQLSPVLQLQRHVIALVDGQCLPANLQVVSIFPPSDLQRMWYQRMNSKIEHPMRSRASSTCQKTQSRQVPGQLYPTCGAGWFFYMQGSYVLWQLRPRLHRDSSVSSFQYRSLVSKKNV